MPKFQRQATHANEPEILQLIDERFEALEETVALAALIPQLHDRLFEVEQTLKSFPTQAMEESLAANTTFPQAKLLVQMSRIKKNLETFLWPTNFPCLSTT
eukprot:Skav217171  [mRNA]  locus=scaffold2777:35316:35618:+ [translate_table: standard]